LISGRLHRVAGGTDLQINVRLGDAKVPEEKAAHSLVVVLAGVNEERLDPPRPLESTDQRGDFHEVRPGAADT